MGFNIYSFFKENVMNFKLGAVEKKSQFEQWIVLTNKNLFNYFLISMIATSINVIKEISRRVERKD